MTEVSVPDNVEPLSTEQYASYPQISLSLPDFPCYNPSVSPSSMPTIRLVDIQITIPTCIEKSTQSTKQHVLPRPKSKISKTNEPNSSSHAHQNTDGYSIDSSKMFSSLISHKNIKVTLDLTLCQCCVRRREAIGLHGSVTVNNQLETVCNTVNRLKHMNNKHGTTPKTADYSVDLDESVDQKHLDNIRTPTVTTTHPTKPIH
ncbi:unnamed protein product [Schistosoma curassoni]|uniref:Uncharacterized protein n=1 Tax=Schistosoma curassoni TaxID=6186 RepID=A0A183JX57_9TREM|nr:unnamed protein product [Schistosoma curassoni]